MLSVQLAHGVRDPWLHTYGMRHACGRGREFKDTEIGRHETLDNVDATTQSGACNCTTAGTDGERETLNDASMGELTARRH